MRKVIIKTGHFLVGMTLYVCFSFERNVYVTLNGTTIEKQFVTEL
jgi:hypothetical protein